MAQSKLVGCTCYNNQSKMDILSDLVKFIEITEKFITFFISKTDILKKQNYWNNIPYDFRLTLETTHKQIYTNLYDIKLIIDSIKKDSISNENVELLNKVGVSCSNINMEYSKTFDKEGPWVDFNNPLFNEAYDLYIQGRNYFGTLIDAMNMADRLKDYISPISPISQYNITQNIPGDYNQIAGINNGEMILTNNSNDTVIKDIDYSISKINECNDIELSYKTNLISLLSEIKLALIQNNSHNQETYKSKLKNFLSTTGNTVIKINEIITSCASLVKFLELVFK